MDPRRTFRLLGIAILAICAFGVVSIVAIRLLDRPPFLITLEPAETGAIVQFIQPIGMDAKMLVSPKFMVTTSASEPFQAALTSDNVAIPGATVELGDTTVVPGAFHVRFGNTLFQVMSSGIIVNGQDYEWLTRPVSTGAVINVSR